MSPNPWFRRAGRALLIVLATLIAATTASAEWKEQVLYSFQGGSSDGAGPAGGVVFDKAGNLYGATTAAGPDNCFPIAGECGLVFQLSPPAKKGDAWTETILYEFKGKTSNDASVPAGGVILDAAGNVYGTTAYGGTGGCVLLGTNAGCGTVYELSPPAKEGGPWTETILYSFQSGNDGYFPWGSLTFDTKGKLYGATYFGGGKGNTCNAYYGGNCGTVFELSPPKPKAGAWTEQVLHSFSGGPDGANPNGGLIFDSSGALYGTTPYGGIGNCQGDGEVGCGTAFKLEPPKKKGDAWTEEILHRFAGGSKDTNTPDSGLVWDEHNNLYGTTYGGNNSGGDDGSVFELTHPPRSGGRWNEIFPVHFRSCNSQYECAPSNLTFDSVGNLYVTTGVIFRMKPPRKKDGQWSLSLIYKFVGLPDGNDPLALAFSKTGSIFGTTLYGGTGSACQAGCGTVFEVSP